MYRTLPCWCGQCSQGNFGDCEHLEYTGEFASFLLKGAGTEKAQTRRGLEDIHLTVSEEVLNSLKKNDSDTGMIGKEDWESPPPADMEGWELVAWESGDEQIPFYLRV